MTATLEQSPPPDLTADDLYADEPDDLDETAGQDGAPYGYTVDRKTGEQRPKKRPGRPKVPPTAEELAGQVPVEPEPDAPPPDRPARRRHRTRAATEPVPAMPRGGVIAREVNRLYRRGGKIVRHRDHRMHPARGGRAGRGTQPDRRRGVGKPVQDQPAYPPVDSPDHL
jgi:hypothetical protein